jgi:hypothetical protein
MAQVIRFDGCEFITRPRNTKSSQKQREVYCGKEINRTAIAETFCLQQIFLRCRTNVGRAVNDKSRPLGFVIVAMRFDVVNEH